MVWFVSCGLARILVHPLRLVVPVYELVVFHVDVVFCCGVLTARMLVRLFALLLDGCFFSVVCCFFSGGVFTRISARQARLFALFMRAVYVPCLFYWLRHLVLLVLLSGVYRCTASPPLCKVLARCWLISTLGVLSCFCHCLLWLSVA